MSINIVGRDALPQLDRTLDTQGEVGRTANQGVFEGREVSLTPSTDGPGGQRIRDDSRDRLSHWMPEVRLTNDGEDLHIGVDGPRLTVSTVPPDRVPPPPPSRHSPALQEQVNTRLMTFEQLVDRMGDHKPTKDLVLGPFVLHRNSVAFKEVESALDLYHFVLNDVRLGEVENSERLLVALRGELAKAEAGAQRYLQRHEGNPDRAVQCDGMRALLGQVAAERRLLDEVEGDPELGRLTDRMTFGQALQLRRCGVNLEDCDLDTFTDDRIDGARSEKRYGFGVNNTVSKLAYGDDPPRIFKPELVGVRSTVAATAGIDVSVPHYGNRNLATNEIDRMLGTRLMPESRFVFHEGQLGLLMEKAPGDSPIKKVEYGPFLEEDLSMVQQAMIEGFRVPPAYDPTNPWDTAWAGELAEIGLFVAVNEAGEEAWTVFAPEDNNAFVGFDTGLPAPMEGSLHRQLIGLQWNDAITGQVDRHGQNYLVKVDSATQTVTVTGIDNDVAFSPRQDRVPDLAGNARGFHATGLPALIDRDTLDRLARTDFDRDVAPRLQGLLTEQEVDATRARFAEAREHALSLPGSHVVDDWATWRSPDGETVSQFLRSQPEGSNFFARDLARYLPDNA